MPMRHVKNGVMAPSFLTSELDRGEWSVSHSDLFTPAEIAPGTHGIEGWFGLTARLDAVENIEILPLPEIEPRPRSLLLCRV
jgi:hypothetical protein